MTVREVLDPRLLDAIESFPVETFDGRVWRVTWATRDPLQGNFGGGRWSPDGEFEALYMSLKEDGALAEAYHHLSRAPVMSSSQMRINQLQVSLEQIVQLDIKRLGELGVDDPLANRVDYAVTQSIGAAAYKLDLQGLIVPSARWNSDNLVLFLDRIDLNTQIELTDSGEVNWPAWRERHPPR